MPVQTFRRFQALILVGLGLFILQRFWSGKLYYYINQRFFGLVILAAIGFLVLAQFVLPDSKADPDGHRPGDDPTDVHHADHGDHETLARPWPLLFLALPILFGLVFPAAPLGASAVDAKGISTSAALNPRIEGETVKMELPADDRSILDWIRAFNFSADPHVFEGEPADVIGFVYHDPRLAEGQFLVSRFALSCCVADAFAIGMIVEWPRAADLAANSWVRVKGSVRVGALEGQVIPVVLAESVEEVPEPAQPYLFP